MATRSVTDQSFATDVLAADRPVLVDFWAEWCGPCKMIAPALEEISDEIGEKVDILKMNIEDNPDVAGELGIRTIPALILFKNGKPVAQRGGGMKSQIKEWLESEI